MRTIVLNRFPDVIQPLLKSLEKFHLGYSDVIIVRDGYEQEDMPYCNIPGLTPFCFSRSANTGIKLASAMHRLKTASSPDEVWTGDYADCALLNDDCVIEQPDFFAKLKSVTESLPARVGILGTLVDGGVGNLMQRWPAKFEDKLFFVPQPLPVCFVCVWLRGKMLDEIGLLDETFTQYGAEDDDLCIRARQKGWSCALSSELWVRHGAGGSMNIRGVNWSKSFTRVDPKFLYDNFDRFRAKYRIAQYETK